MNIPKFISRFAFIAVVALLLTPGPLCAATWESAGLELDKAPIEDILSATSLCQSDEIPKITFLSRPEPLKAWPEEYIQLRWGVLTSSGSSWTHPVYLRTGERVNDNSAPGERVASIWVRNFKASELPEGLLSYYIVTRCGVAHAHVGKVPKPQIIFANNYALRGSEIAIKGSNFMDWRSDELRRVILIEPGQTSDMEVLSWSESEIKARIPDDTLPGRLELYVETGLREDRSRASNSMPLTVVKLSPFPAINVTHLLQEVFSKTKIRINTHKPKRDSTSYTGDDSYVELDTGHGLIRRDILIDEYSFDAGVENAVVKYHLNDINLGSVRVQARENDFLMTMYFEDLHDEYVGEITGLPVGSRLAPPPSIQVDNFRALVTFTLGAENGLITVETTRVEVLGDFRGSGAFCDYAGINVCERLFKKYENDVANQLNFLMVEMLSAPTGKKAISKALEPWHASKGMDEITRCSLRDNSVILDYIPK